MKLVLNHRLLLFPSTCPEKAIHLVTPLASFVLEISTLEIMKFADSAMV